MCNGVPCYSAADHAAIDADIANASAELTNAEGEEQAALVVASQKTTVRQQKAVLLSNYQAEKAYANNNSCP